MYKMKINLSSIWDSKNIYLYRQIVATFAASILDTSVGITLAISGVLLPELKNDSSSYFDDKYSSLFASIGPLTMIVGCTTSGTLVDKFGRRKIQMILAVPFVVGCFIIGYANDIPMLLIGRFITGICCGTFRSISLTYLSELCDPKYRGLALCCPTLAFDLGILYCHVVSQYVSWRSTAKLSAVPVVVSMVTFIFLKESPLWLISTGKVEEGTETFKWFRGLGIDAEKELNLFLNSQSGTLSNTNLRQVIKLIFSKKFMKPFSIAALLFSTLQFSGVNTLIFYILDIIGYTLKTNIDPFIILVIIDCVRIVSVTVICLSGKYISRRKTFFVCSTGTVVSLTILAAILFSKKNNLEGLTLACFILYIGISTTLAVLSWSFLSEIFPADCRGVGSGAGAAVSYILLGISVLLNSTILEYLGIEGMYAGFALLTLMTSTILFFVLPETHGVTLQEIENNLK